eukprot:jgi/Botrbrau1/21459/Bobra.0216s0067.1
MSPPSSGKFKNLSSEEREFLEALESSGELVEDLMEGASRDPSPAPSTPKTKKIKLTNKIKEQLFLEFKEKLLAERQVEGDGVEGTPRPSGQGPKRKRVYTQTPQVAAGVVELQQPPAPPSLGLEEMPPLVDMDDPWTESSGTSLHDSALGDTWGTAPDMESCLEVEKEVEEEEEREEEKEEEEEEGESEVTTGTQSSRDSSRDNSSVTSPRSPTPGRGSMQPRWMGTGGPARAPSPSGLTAQDRQTAYANRHRREAIYQEGDYVLLSTCAAPTLTSNRFSKLQPRHVGPFRVMAVTPDNVNFVTLDLSDRLDIHPRINVCYLKPYWTREEAQSRGYCPPKVITKADGTTHLEWVVDALVDRWLLHDKDGFSYHFEDGTPFLEYLVKWAGHGATEDSWESQEAFETHPGLVNTYHRLQGLAPPIWDQVALRDTFP